MATTTTMTGAAFDQLPYEEGRNLELLDGEVIEVPTALPDHQRIAFKLGISLELYFGKEHSGGLLPHSEYTLDKDTRLAPDISVLLGDRWESLNFQKSPIPGAPDIAVEVISPSERSRISQRKVDQYLAAGTKEVWQFWPDSQKVFVHRGPKSITTFDVNDTLTSPLLPGWELSLQSVFDYRRLY